MEGVHVTTAATISFIERLEEQSSAFYDELAERWEESREAFATFSQDSKKNRTLVVRTYQETISDALEATYSFEGLDLQGHAVDTALAGDASYADALAMAVALEEKACRFYSDVAERSQSLLATIPRAFQRVAKKRERRRLKLQSLLDAAEAAA